MPFTYSRFAYFDTNILSYLAKARNVWGLLRDYFFKNDLTLAISGIHLAELSNIQRNHLDINEFLLSVPAALIKNHEVIISEELKAYPSTRNIDLLHYPLQLALMEADGNAEMKRQLSSDSLSQARISLDKYAELMGTRLKELKPNFNPSKTGKYQREQAEHFSKEIVWQWLTSANPEFVTNKPKEELVAERIKSIWLFSQMVFQRYYLGNREYKKTSDFGDLHHCVFLSYCHLVVMERDLATLLARIQQANTGLIKAKIHNIEFLYQQGWKQKPLQ